MNATASGLDRGVRQLFVGIGRDGTGGANQLRVLSQRDVPQQLFGKLVVDHDGPGVQVCGHARQSGAVLRRLNLEVGIGQDGGNGAQHHGSGEAGHRREPCGMMITTRSPRRHRAREATRPAARATAKLAEAQRLRSSSSVQKVTNSRSPGAALSASIRVRKPVTVMRMGRGIRRCRRDGAGWKQYNEARSRRRSFAITSHLKRPLMNCHPEPAHELSSRAQRSGVEGPAFLRSARSLRSATDSRSLHYVNSFAARTTSLRSG